MTTKTENQSSIDNLVKNSKALFLRVNDPGHTITPDERKQLVNFYLEIISQAPYFHKPY